MLTGKEYQHFLQQTDILSEEEYAYVFSQTLLDTCTPPYWFSDVDSAYRRFLEVQENRKRKARKYDKYDKYDDDE